MFLGIALNFRGSSQWEWKWLISIIKSCHVEFCDFCGGSSFDPNLIFFPTKKKMLEVDGLTGSAICGRLEAQFIYQAVALVGQSGCLFDLLEGVL